MTNIFKTGIIGAMIATLLWTAPTPAAAAPAIEAEAGDSDAEAIRRAFAGKTVSLEIAGGTVSDALIALAKQAEVALAVSADQKDIQKSFTLLVKDKPVGEVLELISAAGDLSLTLQNGVLVVRSNPAGPTGALPPERAAEPPPEATGDSGSARDFKSWKKRFRERQPDWRKKKKRVEFGSPVVVAAGDHLHSAVSMGDDTIIRGHLDDDAVSIGGNVTVVTGAVVEGAAVSIGGNVVIEPGAAVGKDVVAVGGTAQVADTAVVDGDQVSIPLPLPPMEGVAGALGGMLLLNTLCAIARSVFLFAVALLLIWLVPRRVDTVKSYMARKPGVAILSGFLLCIALVPLFIILAITIIGIPLIPVAAVVLVALLLIGITGFVAWIGEKTPLFKKNPSPVKTISLGFLVFTLVSIIPVVGGILMFFAVLAGLGAAFQSRFGGRDAA